MFFTTFSLVVHTVRTSNIFIYYHFLISAAMGAPVNPLDNIRCHCITFYAHDLPAACTLLGAQNLDWNTAQKLASTHRLDIEFASQDTIARILEVDRPLPTSVLVSLRTTKETRHVGTKFICGMDDEVMTTILEAPIEQANARVAEQEACISGVLAIIVLGVILYAICEFAWTR
jgi:hypothetical protein